MPKDTAGTFTRIKKKKNPLPRTLLRQKLKYNRFDKTITSKINLLKLITKRVILFLKTTE